jgi:hypothetical protein
MSLGAPRRLSAWPFLAPAEAAMIAHWVFSEPPVSPGDAALCFAFAAVVGLAGFLCVGGLFGHPRYLLAAVAAVLLAIAVQHVRVSHSDAVRWHRRVAELRHDVTIRCPRDRKRVRAIVERWAASPKDTTIVCVTATGHVGTYANGFHPARLQPDDPPPCRGFKYKDYRGRHLTDGGLRFFYCPEWPWLVAA